MLESTITKKSTLMTHTVRTKDEGLKTLTYGRAMAIKLLCTECMGWEDHPDTCTSTLCPVYPFRAKTLSTQHGDPS